MPIVARYWLIYLTVYYVKPSTGNLDYHTNLFCFTHLFIRNPRPAPSRAHFSSVNPSDSPLRFDSVDANTVSLSVIEANEIIDVAPDLPRLNMRTSSDMNYRRCLLLRV